MNLVSRANLYPVSTTQPAFSAVRIPPRKAWEYTVQPRLIRDTTDYGPGAPNPPKYQIMIGAAPDSSVQAFSDVYQAPQNEKTYAIRMAKQWSSREPLRLDVTLPLTLGLKTHNLKVFPPAPLKDSYFGSVFSVERLLQGGRSALTSKSHLRTDINEDLFWSETPVLTNLRDSRNFNYTSVTASSSRPPVSSDNWRATASKRTGLVHVPMDMTVPIEVTGGEATRFYGLLKKAVRAIAREGVDVGSGTRSVLHSDLASLTNGLAQLDSDGTVHLRHDRVLAKGTKAAKAAAQVLRSAQRLAKGALREKLAPIWKARASGAPKSKKTEKSTDSRSASA